MSNGAPDINYAKVVLWVTGKQVWAVKGRRLFRSNDGGISWKRVGLVAAHPYERLSSAGRLTRRLLRSGVHHIVPLQYGRVLVWFHRRIDLIDTNAGEKINSWPIVGSRPLVVCKDNDRIYYGEYRGNPEKSPVHVWSLGPQDREWLPAWRFNEVRHVHGVFRDDYTGSIWVTTGDRDDESALWRSCDDFKSLERVAGGSQQLRAVQLLFTRSHVYFGTDTASRYNYINRLCRRTGKVDRLQKVGGPVFFGCKVGDSLFFSTTCEPSTVNTSRFSEVWRSDDGESWRRFLTFRKDWWPMKYFQYGQVKFPSGPGDGKHLWLTPFATKGDQKSIRIRIQGR